jgi:ISXO2-like transposase domain
VEVDETFLDGKQENRHWKERQKYSGRGAAHTGKVGVIGAISRKGNVVCQIIENTNTQAIATWMLKAISTNS